MITCKRIYSLELQQPLWIAELRQGLNGRLLKICEAVTCEAALDGVL